MRTLKLPTADGTLAGYTLTGNTLAAAPVAADAANSLAQAAATMGSVPQQIPQMAEA